jgi:hypothetical protein
MPALCLQVRVVVAAHLRSIYPHTLLPISPMSLPIVVSHMHTRALRPHLQLCQCVTSRLANIELDRQMTKDKGAKPVVRTLVTVPWKLRLSRGQYTVMRLPNRLSGSMSVLGHRATLALRTLGATTTLGTDLHCRAAAAASLGLSRELLDCGPALSGCNGPALTSASGIGTMGSALCTSICRTSLSLYSATNVTWYTRALASYLR